MSTDRSAEYLVGLGRELCKLPRETEWVEGNKAVASRLIRDAVDAGVIRLVNKEVGDKLRAYVPTWA